jgi:large subunit ribosomal protein L4
MMDEETMKKVTVYSRDGGEAGTVELPDEIFGIKPSMNAIYQSTKAHLTNRRQGTAKAKTRSEVNVSKQKPYRQKGTGRARAGSANSPVWVGGGVSFGPSPHDYKERLNKKLKRLALKSAYSIKASEDRVKVVEDFELETPKTKEVSSMLKALGIGGEKIMFLTGSHDGNMYKSSRNIALLNINAAENASTYDLMNSDVLLMTKSAVDKVKELLAK